MKINNPIFTNDGRIDVEIEHPVYGWIPFTASESDTEGHGRAIYAAALAAGPASYKARPALVPAVVPKVALVRAMRLTPFGGDTAWGAVKAALAGAPEEAQEDWSLATLIPRADTALNAMAVAIAGDQADAMLNALFTLADQIDKGA